MELKEEKKGERGEGSGGGKRGWRGEGERRATVGSAGGREEGKEPLGERERSREKWAPSERGQPRATSRDATLLREGFVARL